MHDISLMVIGQRIRHRRQQLKRTLDEVARATGLSCSLLSKVENFRTIPSLPVLARISAALEADMAEFVAGVAEPPADTAYTLVRAGERTAVEREESHGFQYDAILSKGLDSCFWQSVVLTLHPGAERQPAITDGEEFLLLLSGQCELVLGAERVTLEEGDAMYFDGRIPHVPRNHGAQPAVLFVTYFLAAAHPG